MFLVLSEPFPIGIGLGLGIVDELKVVYFRMKVLLACDDVSYRRMKSCEKQGCLFVLTVCIPYAVESLLKPVIETDFRLSVLLM